MKAETKKCLGIDWGQKRIGLAIALPGVDLALPYSTVTSLDEVIKVIAQEEIQILVLGQPTKMKGGSDLDPAFLAFSVELKARVKIPNIFQDERLSSLAGDKLIGAKKDKAGRDAIAAMIILQSYLDKVK
jgi:putative transcription antitermination factor YqgF